MVKLKDVTSAIIILSISAFAGIGYLICIMETLNFLGIWINLFLSHSFSVCIGLLINIGLKRIKNIKEDKKKWTKKK